jgi:hypothetical protein
MKNEKVYWRYTKLRKQDLLIKGIANVLFRQRGEDEPIDKIDINNFNVINLIINNKGGNKIIYNKNIELHFENKYLGLDLGYPPLCVSKFNTLVFNSKNKYFLNHGLNYNGITFNTLLETNYAINWCIENYEEKILNEFGFSEFTVGISDKDIVIKRYKDNEKEIIYINNQKTTFTFNELIQYIRENEEYEKKRIK